MTEIAHIQLPEDSDMMMADSIRQDIIVALGSAPSLHVDAEEVARISTATFQVLIAAAQKVSGQGGEFKILNCSDVFNNAAKSLGLDSFLIGTVDV